MPGGTGLTPILPILAMYWPWLLPIGQDIITMVEAGEYFRASSATVSRALKDCEEGVNAEGAQQVLPGR